MFSFVKEVLTQAVELDLLHVGGQPKGALGNESQADVDDFDYELGQAVSFADILAVSAFRESEWETREITRMMVWIKNTCCLD